MDGALALGPFERQRFHEGARDLADRPPPARRHAGKAVDEQTGALAGHASVLVQEVEQRA